MHAHTTKNDPIVSCTKQVLSFKKTSEITPTLNLSVSDHPTMIRVLIEGRISNKTNEKADRHTHIRT